MSKILKQKTEPMKTCDNSIQEQFQQRNWKRQTIDEQTNTNHR